MAGVGQGEGGGGRRAAPGPGPRAADEGAEAAQDALDLPLLLDLQLAPGVGEVDDGEGLDEDGSAALGDVVDDAAHLAAKVGLDWHHVAAVAQGDDGLLGGERSEEHT